MFSSILEKRLLLVSGKGGVGKTTVSLALARVAARSGKKTLLITLSAEQFLTSLYDAPIGYEEKQLEKDLFAMHLDPQHSLHEYVVRQIKFEFLYRAVFENRVVKYFLDATPGLKDLLLLGKIIDEAQPKRLRGYDLVVVDMPATGHGLHMLRVAKIVKSMVQAGPLHKHASRMDELISNPEFSAVCLVTLPEEMPVNETLEMLEALKKDLKIPVGAVFVNALYSKLFEPGELTAFEQKSSKQSSALSEAMLRCAWAQVKRFGLQSEQTARLREMTQGLAFFSLPFLFERRFGLTAMDQLSQSISLQMAGR